MIVIPVALLQSTLLQPDIIPVFTWTPVVVKYQVIVNTTVAEPVKVGMLQLPVERVVTLAHVLVLDTTINPFGSWSTTFTQDIALIHLLSTVRV